MKVSVPAGSKRPAERDGELERLDVEALEQKLSASREGLSGEDAARRLDQYGYNEMPEEKRSVLLRLLSYFWGPIPWMIEIAAGLSAAVQHWPDLGIILTLLVTNAGVGFWEEYQAGNAIAALKANLSPEALVRRDGAWKTISARELVPGDLIRLQIGAIVPADARVVEDTSVDIDQSQLTGESLPVKRGRGEAVYSGSVVKRGEAEAFVYATGRATYFGKTATLVETTETVSHFQRAVLQIGNYLIVLALALVAVIVAVSVLRDEGVISTLQFALVLTIAGIPVAMPTVLSVTLAVGARLLARRKAIVSRLAAVEELAGVDVLCSDKTGTLTENRLTLGEPHPVGGVSPQEVIETAALASRREGKDQIDLAVLGGLDGRAPDPALRVVKFEPFDPVQKRATATLEAPGRHFKASKGAPQVILAMSANKDGVRDEVDATVQEFARRGFRSLGVARTDGDGQWQFIGVMPLYDPPREDAKETIATAREMGLAVKMVTGDQVAIGREIGREVGLGTDIEPPDLLARAIDHETDPALADEIERADGFAQVFPEHKHALVGVLQRRGHIVGMTGDGVNDAPALKRADAGIAVSGATDAARSAADISLLEPGLSVLVDAIKESRRTFQRMNSYAIYRIAETIRVLLFMTLSILVFSFFPVTAIMIVLLALLNDGAILSIAYDRTAYARHPEAWDMPLVLALATALGIAGVMASFMLFALSNVVFGFDHDHIRTLMYLKLSVAGHLTIFATRTRGPFWSSRPSNVLLIAVFGTQVIATMIASYGLFMTPVGWGWAAFAWGYAIAWFLFNDRVKLATYRVVERWRARVRTTVAPAHA